MNPLKRVEKRAKRKATAEKPPSISIQLVPFTHDPIHPTFYKTLDLLRNLNPGDMVFADLLDDKTAASNVTAQKWQQRLISMERNTRSNFLRFGQQYGLTVTTGGLSHFAIQGKDQHPRFHRRQDNVTYGSERQVRHITALIKSAAKNAARNKQTTLLAFVDPIHLPYARRALTAAKYNSNITWPAIDPAMKEKIIQAIIEKEVYRKNRKTPNPRSENYGKLASAFEAARLPIPIRPRARRLR